MAHMMVNHLSQIIGQEHKIIPQIGQVECQAIATIQEKIILITTVRIQGPFTKEKCWQVLKEIDKKKSPRWDGITIEFWLEL